MLRFLVIESFTDFLINERVDFLANGVNIGSINTFFDGLGESGY